jgi:glutamine synthetase
MNFKQELIQKNKAHSSTDQTQYISEFFGQNTFDLKTLKEYVSEETFQEMKGATLKQQKIEFSTAEQMAKGMMRWAMEREVTHFTHWFQPLTDSPAEKHDAFFKPAFDLEARGIEELSGSELIKREPDGSSFPSGGLRETHAARGYSIWDPSSPPFILETELGKTLYVPAVFISITGEALDYKTPLLKANHALNKAATAVCQYFDSQVTHVFTNLGWEQEYFLVDESFYNARPDLLLAGRTIFGGKSAKGQQMDDHYFGSIPERVQNFMKDFEQEGLKLGIPIVTRHNEVAPGQFECAPMFEETNMAVDNNQLLRVIMEKIAIKHKFRILFHEKPFAGLNGSGKHCNWSMSTGTGKNLFSPGDDPGSNLQFITFLINFIKAIHDNGDLLRASVATAGNDHRLGANEAPPAIISIFTGSLLEQILKEFKATGLSKAQAKQKELIDLGLTKIPVISKDYTDRNRTSPLPFTDNRFEFRSAGSSANCAAPITVLNAIVADQLQAFKAEVDKLEAKKPDIEANIITVLQGYMEDVERVVFNGNGYSKEWEEEAMKRGLSNNKNTPSALLAMVSDKSKALFERQSVYNPRELESRYDVLLENYINKIGIEADLFQEMSRTYVLPSAYKSINRLSNTYNNLEGMGLKDQAKNLVDQATSTANLCEKLNKDLLLLKEAIANANGVAELPNVAKAYAESVYPYFEKVRASIDLLEGMVDNDDWKLPKYREILFIR